MKLTELKKEIENLKAKIGVYEILNFNKYSIDILSKSNIYLTLCFIHDKYVAIDIFNRAENKRYNTINLEYSNKKQKEFIYNSFKGEWEKWKIIRKNTYPKN